MASGVKITDEVKEAYQKVSLKTTKSTKLRCAVFKFSEDNKQIVVDQVYDDKNGDCDYESILQCLPPNDVRYFVYDLDHCNKEGTPTSQLVFVSWHPDACPIKKKMLCASSLNAIKQALSVTKNVIEGDTLTEVDLNAALEKVGGTPVKK